MRLFSLLFLVRVIAPSLADRDKKIKTALLCLDIWKHIVLTIKHLLIRARDHQVISARFIFSSSSLQLLPTFLKRHYPLLLLSLLLLLYFISSCRPAFFFTSSPSSYFFFYFLLLKIAIYFLLRAPELTTMQGKNFVACVLAFLFPLALLADVSWAKCAGECLSSLSFLLFFILEQENKTTCASSTQLPPWRHIALDSFTWRTQDVETNLSISMRKVHFRFVFYFIFTLFHFFFAGDGTMASSFSGLLFNVFGEASAPAESQKAVLLSSFDVRS